MYPSHLGSNSRLEADALSRGILVMARSKGTVTGGTSPAGNPALSPILDWEQGGLLRNTSSRGQLCQRRYCCFMSIKLVVAHDREGGIGRGGQLPWSLPGEMKRLAATTLRTMVPGRKNALVMGRATYESLPSGRRPLPGRLNIAVTSRPIPDTGVLTASSLASAMNLSARWDWCLPTASLFFASSVDPIAPPDALGIAPRSR